MSSFAIRAVCALTLMAGLSACVPTTPPAAEPVVLPAEVATQDIYLATSDNGIAIPAIDPAKVPSQFQRQVVDFPSTEAPGTVIINPATKHLYFITGKNKAIRYGISVGAAGFEWSGQALVTNRRQWPTWTPPKEMIERKPELAKWEKGQPGGPTNPLGSRALYLTTNGVDYGYRIHGTPDWWSIGKNASSGCIRMINQDVIDLYNRVPDGAKVIVLTASGEIPKGLNLPPPAPKKKKPAAQPAVVAPAVASAADTPPALIPATVTGPMSTAPVAAGQNLPTPTPAAITPAPAAVTPAPVLTAPVVPATPAVTAPVKPAVTAPTPATVAPVVPAMPAAPAATPAPAAAAPAAPAACPVPLVNGLCPQG